MVCRADAESVVEGGQKCGGSVELFGWPHPPLVVSRFLAARRATITRASLLRYFQMALI